MPEPKLSREVDLPRPRSSGAAVVAVAALAMFTAVGASAFVVRVRMSPCARGPHPRPAVAMNDVVARTAAADVATIRNAFLDAVTRGDEEQALDWYAYLPPRSEAAAELAPIRNSVANAYLSAELGRVAADADAGDCEAANRRLSRLRRLLPEADLPTAMSQCAPAQLAPIQDVGPERTMRGPVEVELRSR